MTTTSAQTPTALPPPVRPPPVRPPMHKIKKMIFTERLYPIVLYTQEFERMGNTQTKPKKVKDDNDEILSKLSKCPDIFPAIKDRLALGRERYGHGVIVNTDTTQFGTKNDDWLEMAHEEFYDGIVYLAAEEIRRERNNKKKGTRKKIEYIRKARQQLIETVRLLEKHKN